MTCTLENEVETEARSRLRREAKTARVHTLFCLIVASYTPLVVGAILQFDTRERSSTYELRNSPSDCARVGPLAEFTHSIAELRRSTLVTAWESGPHETLAALGNGPREPPVAWGVCVAM